MEPKIIFLIFLTFLVVVLSLFYLVTWFFGAPFEPISEKKLKKLLKLTNPKKKDKVAELGSGDGRIVIAFAKQGIETHGYEINPFLVLLSKYKIKNLGLQNKAFIHWKNFWKQDLSQYSIITLFQFKTIMKSLENKIKLETKSKTKIISHVWKFPNLKIKKQIDNIYLYEIK